MVHWTVPAPEASALPLLAAGLGAAPLARVVGGDLDGRLAVFSACAPVSQATPRFWGALRRDRCKWSSGHKPKDTRAALHRPD
jgi:hypothetical protein